MATERSPKRRPVDGRRAQLIEAATRVVATDGVAAATTRRIAQEAGVPHGLVHYWFSGKDELLEEVVQNMLRQLEQAVAEPVVASAPANLPDDLTARFRSAFAVVQGDDSGRQIALYELTTWSLRSRQFRDVARAQYAAYRTSAEVMVQPWQAAHLTGLPGSPEILAQFVATLFDGVNLAWLADPEGTKPDEIFAFVGALLAQYQQPAEASQPGPEATPSH